MIFKKPEANPTNGDNARPQETRSKWQMQMYHLGAIEKHMAAYMDLNSMDNFDMQKGADFVRHKRELITHAFEEAGGTVEPSSIEQEIKDFLPRAIRERADEQTN